MQLERRMPYWDCMIRCQTCGPQSRDTSGCSLSHHSSSRPDGRADNLQYTGWLCIDRMLVGCPITVSVLKVNRITTHTTYLTDNYGRTPRQSLVRVWPCSFLRIGWLVRLRPCHIFELEVAPFSRRSLMAMFRRCLQFNWMHLDKPTPFSSECLLYRIAIVNLHL